MLAGFIELIPLHSMCKLDYNLDLFSLRIRQSMDHKDVVVFSFLLIISSICFFVDCTDVIMESYLSLRSQLRFAAGTIGFVNKE